jgi:hypothetical protein
LTAIAALESPAAKIPARSAVGRTPWSARDPLVALCLLLLLLLTPACKKKHPTAVLTSSSDGALATMLHVSDPRTAPQLIKGFYPIENRAWRWTQSKFSVSLRPPLTGPKNGARLVLKFVIPQVVLDKLHSLQLSAKVNGIDLAPQEYTKSGEQTYTRDVPAIALPLTAVNVDFALDKFLPPSPADNRELGVIVSAVGFEAK